VRLGAVGYLNARPLVYGLERSPRFDVRYDIPSECARLLHAGAIDVGLIPSIEYLRGGPYRIVPDLAIASAGPVASVAIFTRRPIADVQSIAMDTSSRTSVALTRVLCARLFRIDPTVEMRGPDLNDMLERSDAALIIGDNALLLDGRPGIEKIDLGEAWTDMTGLPFVYAFWAGRPGALTGADVDALRAAVERAPGAPDVLVNVAGVFFEHRITELSVEDWDLTLDTNLKGTFLTCKTFLPAMIAAGSGTIVNIASTAGIRGGHTRAAYCAAKAGVVNFTRSLALDHGGDGVRVCCVCPGLIDTPMADWITSRPDALAKFEQSIPARRIGTVDDIAGVVSFMASDAADYMHGAVVVVDGGASA
jgi:chorismate dehydratase